LRTYFIQPISCVAYRLTCYLARFSGMLSQVGDSVPQSPARPCPRAHVAPRAGPASAEMGAVGRRTL